MGRTQRSFHRQLTTVSLLGRGRSGTVITYIEDGRRGKVHEKTNRDQASENTNCTNEKMMVHEVLGPTG